jgi:hypothetical protein
VSASYSPCSLYRLLARCGRLALEEITVSQERGADDVGAHEATPPLTDEQLAAFEQGWAAIIMPVRAGWKIQYVSPPSFEEESGTTFETIDEALAAIREVLSAVNSSEERERARQDLERRQSN